MKDKSPKTVHLFQYNLYTKAFLEFINKEYSQEEHYFIVYGKSRGESFKIGQYENCRVVNRLEDIFDDKNLCCIIDNSLKLIVHSNNISITKLFLKKRAWLKKAYIVFWGFDIYCYRNKAGNLKQSVWRQIAKSQIRNAKGICTLSDGDVDVLKSFIHGIKGKWYKAIYVPSMDVNQIIKIRNFNKSTSPYKIIVGNSAFETNQHIEILDLLSKHKNEDIIIYCPLSYGSEEYRNKIIEYGKSIFGSKFIPLTELMPQDEYKKLLNQCIAGFFNNNRQQAMGNISSLLGFGSKVYIRTDTPMWERYNKIGYQVYDILSVSNMSWKEIVEADKEILIQNSNIYDSLLSTKRYKSIWDVIFDSE